jgi:hypothetical protein
VLPGVPLLLLMLLPVPTAASYAVLLLLPATLQTNLLYYVANVFVAVSSYVCGPFMRCQVIGLLQGHQYTVRAGVSVCCSSCYGLIGNMMMLLLIMLPSAPVGRGVDGIDAMA